MLGTRGYQAGAVLLLTLACVWATACGSATEPKPVSGAELASASAEDAAAQGSPVIRLTEEESDLPSVQTDAFDFRSDGLAQDGDRLYRVTIRAGGSPSLVALSRFTPLFDVNGKSASQFVEDAFFEQNPQRTPRTIQPG